jgi:integrase
MIASEVTRADVRALHRWIGDKGRTYAANRVVALVRHLFNWGEREGLLPEGHPNPVRGIERYREEARERFLSPDEAKRVVTAIGREGNVYLRAYFLLALLLGTRKRELLGARWEDIDEARWTLRLPETKSGRSHELPLAADAQEILRSLPRLENNPFVFPGMKEGEPLSVEAIDKAWVRIRTAAGLPDVRLHDLRRTLGAWIVQQTGSLALVGALLNHSDPRVTAAHYARFADETRRKALGEHGQTLLKLAGIESAAAILASRGGKVVALRRGA